VDFATQTTKLDVPVYFLQRHYDLVEMGTLLERWFYALDAPRKEVIYFENSGHTPHPWEPSKVVEMIVNRVRPETHPAPALPSAREE
jgi:pimeloyl-ACP methyl ester carboxylesterase